MTHERCWVRCRCVAEGLELTVLFVQVFNHLDVVVNMGEVVRFCVGWRLRERCCIVEVVDVRSKEIGARGALVRLCVGFPSLLGPVKS